MIYETINYGETNFECILYDEEDVAKFLDIYFLWKISALLAKETKTKNLQLPATFSERIVCYALNLYHKPSGTGPDAFKKHNESQFLPVEIKATMTNTGYTDVKRDGFDYLYWLDLQGYADNTLKIYEFALSDIIQAIDGRKSRGNRTSIGLAQIADSFGKSPVFEGYIAVIKK